MSLSHLSDEQHKKLGQILSSAIVNKEYPHPADLQRAALIVFSMLKKYPFDDTDIDLAIEATGEKYADLIKKILGQMIEVFPYLIEGLENPANEKYLLSEGL